MINQFKSIQDWADKNKVNKDALYHRKRAGTIDILNIKDLPIIRMVEIDGELYQIYDDTKYITINE